MSKLVPARYDRSVASTADLFLVTLLGLPLVTPLLRWLSVPCTHDGHLHYHRVAAIRHAWENGLYFSRWLPDLAFGYGYPFFLYREPLPLYLTHFLHLAGLPLPAASNLFYIVCLLAAGWFTYLWVRDIFGPRAGIVSAVAYMAAPYQIVDALVRGNQVESMALALLPAIFWTARRFFTRGTAGWFLLATLGLVALSLSHNISLFLFTPALILYLMAVGWQRELPQRTLLTRLLLLIMLGLGMTSFYTGSALLEMDEVQLSRSTVTRNNNFRYNFTSLEELLGPAPAENPALINPPLPFRVGWAPAILAMLGLLSFAWNRKQEQRVHIILMAGGTLLFLLLSLPLAQPLWEAIPLIEFVQFPWRLVGRAALPIAVLAGAPFAAGAGEQLASRRGRLFVLLMIAAIGLVILEAFPLLYPTYCQEEGFPTITDVHAYEATTGLVGVDPEGSYFPRTVERRPEGSPLLADYAAQRAPQRFDETALPAEASVLRADYAPNWARLEIESPEPFQARYLTFAFPGWTASVDGESVAITPSEPEGLITFPVHSGVHTITVSWELTPLRLAFLFTSLAALIATLAAAVVLRRRVPAAALQRPFTPLTRRTRLLILALGLLLLAGKWFVDRAEAPLRRSAPPAVAYEGGLAAGGLHLAGYNLSRTVVPAGATVVVDLAWEVLAPPGAAYQSHLSLVGPDGRTWSEKETYRPRLYEDAPPTTAWLPGQWAWDSRELRVLPGTPPGSYDIVLTLFALDTLQPLTLLDADRAIGPTAVIGRVEVTRPDEAPPVQPQVARTAIVDGLRLLGHNQDRAEAAPGDPILLTLFWERSPGESQPAEQLSVELRAGSGDPVQAWRLPPVRADYPPSEWATGDRLRGQHLLRLPAALQSGEYQFWLEDLPLGSIAITAPARSYTPPDFTVAVNAIFGDQAELVGYSLSPATILAIPSVETTTPFTVTLAWKGLAEMEIGYRVFVHLLDANGQTVAQSDAEPVGWTRPTTGWAPGEYLTDRHRLTLPVGTSGPFRLRVGLYEAGTGRRLQTAGKEFIVLDDGQSE